MTDWDADSRQLRENLVRILADVQTSARRRDVPAIEAARRWQRAFMEKLEPNALEYVGRFRGEPGLEHCQVRIGTSFGAPPDEVAAELRSFERRLQEAVVKLDEVLVADGDMDEDGLAAVVDLCAWAHSEWVRIHPFVNGNGRTARLWANAIAMRYGLPPFVRLRPRPDAGYERCAAAAMEGRWIDTVPVFRQMLREAVRND